MRRARRQSPQQVAEECIRRGDIRDDFFEAKFVDAKKGITAQLRVKSRKVQPEPLETDDLEEDLDDDVDQDYKPDEDHASSESEDEPMEIEGGEVLEEVAADDGSQSTVYAQMKKQMINEKKQRRAWTDEENVAIREFFRAHLDGRKKTVKADEIRECLRRKRCLQSRTEAQIRVKINNIMKGKEKFLCKFSKQRNF